MSLSLEGLKHLMRGSECLPDNLSEMEIKHYAAQVLKRLQRGDDVERLGVYFQSLDTTNTRRLRISAGTHALAKKVHVLFNATAAGPLRG